MWILQYGHIQTKNSQAPASEVFQWRPNRCNVITTQNIKIKEYYSEGQKKKEKKIFLMILYE